MSKKISIIAGITAMLIGIFGWQIHSFSQDTDEQFNKLISDLNEDGEDLYGVKDCEKDACCMIYKGAMGYVEKAWSENLKNLTDQPKPASDMVDEAYESLRTYQCQLEYICRAVEYSGYAPPESTFGTNKLTSDQIGTIPGCQKPEDLGVPDTWDSFISFLKDNWNVMKGTLTAGGAQEINVNFPADYFTGNGIPFFPQCMSDITNKNAVPDLVTSRSNYQRCIALLDSKFACKGDETSLKDCTSASLAFIQVETALRKSQADQKARALENKLSSIITKMLTMEMHAEYLKTKLQNLDQLYSCYPSKCD
jgi:hypothetical protein